jgi:UDP-N-acetyl-D-glucosamine/UDP-N-acetyl-D-galactosamine dehydrogenase
MIKNGEAKIAMVGLGYVGLPLAVMFGRHVDVIGFDISEKKIGELRQYIDTTLEVTTEDLKGASIFYTTDPAELKKSSFVIVTVPTPIDDHQKPDLSPVISATRTVGRNLAKGSIVVYESTVYPGVTEDICVPILEQESGLVCGQDFKVGYSPERINPGDKVHTVDKIVKVVSGQDIETLETVAEVYTMVISAGIHKAATIRVAEAAKVIENTQRDINIALMNELSVIFNKMGIRTKDVLEAAGTKWNFLKFVPGLVGGHCIGVDPYYLTYKAEEVGYHPEVILAGRRINDSMGKYVAEMTVKKLIQANKHVKGAKMLVLGLTFKENCPDIRNSKVVDILEELKEYEIQTYVHDPMASPEDAKAEYGVDLVSMDEIPPVDGVIWAVAHEKYATLNVAQLKKFCANGAEPGVIIDIKSSLCPSEVEDAGLLYFCL